MIRPYETVVVFDGTQSDDVLKKEQEKVEKLLREHARFEKTEVWGKQELAYEVNKKRVGTYCLFLYEGTGEAVTRLDNEFRLNAIVLRHLSVVRTPKPAAQFTAPEVKADVKPPAQEGAQ